MIICLLNKNDKDRFSKQCNNVDEDVHNYIRNQTKT